MKIREANLKDIPQILQVLRASLGETSSKKTEQVWRYKHIDNPFGQSLVLVAEEDQQIIGVRAFMRWKWQKSEQIYSAYRAVDTATHPSHQGKGIFKKLTLEALKIGKERGDHFIFNTPNNQSKPGYLKMGWEEVSRLKIQLRPLLLLPLKRGEIIYKVTGKPETIVNLLDSYNKRLLAHNLLFTPKDIDFLKWRYINNPLQQYVVIFEKNYFFAGYLKTQKGIKELRVSELIFSHGGGNAAKKTILELGKSSGANVLSFSPLSGIPSNFSISAKMGPVLTFRSLNSDQPELLKLKNWFYSIGDLELF